MSEKGWQSMPSHTQVEWHRQHNEGLWEYRKKNGQRYMCFLHVVDGGIRWTHSANKNEAAHFWYECELYGPLLRAAKWRPLKIQQPTVATLPDYLT